MLTVAEVRGLVESDASDLSDESLQILLDEAEADLTREIGEDDDTERDEILDGAASSIYLSRRINEIDSIQERPFQGDYAAVGAGDYDFKGRKVRRLNGIWGQQVEVTYTPVAEADQRKALVSRLVALAAQYTPQESSNVGGIQKRTREYLEAKENVLADARGIRGAVLGV